MYTPHLNKLIRSRRQELGISQARLALMLGYPTGQFISNIEAGRSQMPRKKLRRLCRGLLLDSNLVYSALVAEYMTDLAQDLGLK